MKKLIVILIVILIGSCSSNNIKISVKSDPCKDTQVFLEFAEDMKGWWGKDSKISTMAMTLAIGAYQNCLSERRKNAR